MSESDYTRWNDRARSRIAELGVTQAALGAAKGAKTARVGHYLTGRNDPPLNHLILMCRYLQVGADWLLFGGPHSPRHIPSAAEGIVRQIEELDAPSRRDIEGYVRIQQATK